MYIKQILVFLALNLVAAAAFALPQPFNATYTVSKGGLTLGEMKVSLSYKDGIYRYYKSSHASGLASILSGDKIVENVIGKYQGDSLQPTNYLYHHTSNRKDRKDQFQFTGATHVRGTYKGAVYDLEVPRGAIDRASFELALSRDLSLNKKNLTYSLVEKGKLKNYTLRRLGQEAISINGKQYQTVKLMIERDSTKRETVLWLSKEVNYMPVKIEHVEKGSAVQTVLKSINKW